MKGISTATNPEPLPIIFSTSILESFKLTPSDLRTFAATPVPSPINLKKFVLFQQNYGQVFLLPLGQA